MEVVEHKPIEHVKDETLILIDMARKAMKQVESFLDYLLRDKMDSGRARELAHLLSSGRWTHDYPITAEQLEKFGLPIRVGLPREVYELMELYPQPSQRRPSVQYIPTPYDGRSDNEPRENKWR